MRRFPTILISAAFAVALPLATLPSSAWASGDDDVSKVNGSVTVEAGQPAGDVSTVNGSVHIGNGAKVGSLCILDQQPGLLTGAKREMLRKLARVASYALEGWAARRVLKMQG